MLCTTLRQSVRGEQRTHFIHTNTRFFFNHPRGPNRWQLIYMNYDLMLCARSEHERSSEHKLRKLQRARSRDVPDFIMFTHRAHNSRTRVHTIAEQRQNHFTRRCNDWPPCAIQTHTQTHTQHTVCMHDHTTNTAASAISATQARVRLSWFRQFRVHIALASDALYC